MGVKEHIELLGKYTYWLTKSPWRILVEVKSVGGWSVVFPGELPKWAHRVRNFFNLEPFFLMRLDQSAASNETQKLNIQNLYLTSLNKNKITDAIGEHGALSGDVYKDAADNSWFQMDAGGAIYHFKEVKQKVPEAVLQSLAGQSMTPIFKLISPDKTGGSCETILKNYPGIARSKVGLLNLPGVNRIIENAPFGLGDSGGYYLGEVNEPLPVAGLNVDYPEYRGSYNYAETVVKGLSAHEKFDIHPHEYDPTGYIKVPGPYPFSDLKSRRFPTYDKGSLVAGLKWKF